MAGPDKARGRTERPERRRLDEGGALAIEPPPGDLLLEERER